MTRIKQSCSLPRAVLIYGLGKTGKSLIRFLLRRGIKVYAYDDNPKVFQDETIQRLSSNPNFQPIQSFKNTEHKAQIRPNRLNAFFKPLEIELAIVSPGVPVQAQKDRIVQVLSKNKVPLIDELEFTSYFIKKPIIAVTGTNGKSTTTSLIAKILTADKRKVFCGGNLAPGLPFSQALLLKEKDFYVVEVSSFQLERCYNFKPKVAVLLNITEDHLDRHASKDEYIALKFRIFARQDKNDSAIVNFDDPVVVANLSQIRAQTYYFSMLNAHFKGAYIRDGMIYFSEEGREKAEMILPISKIKIPGEHNLRNVLAAICVAKIIGVNNQSIRRAIAQFTGLPHRLELVKELQGVKYINNSMCTNPAAAISSLLAVKKPVILITGGKEKNLDINYYLKTISKEASYTILIGENRYRLKTELLKLNYHNLKVCDSLEEAVKIASVKASRLGQIATVLFSPGFASFDFYANFIERGEAFRNAVNKLTTKTGKALNSNF